MECQEPESKADDEGKVIGDSSHIISSVSRLVNKNTAIASLNMYILKT